MLQPNPGKDLDIVVAGKKYQRLPIRTHVIKKEDELVEVVQKYVSPHLQDGDFVFISEKIVAITQGRAFPIKDIQPRWLATFLSRFVQKTPHGIGLGSPWTMELALQDVGVTRILLAAFVGAVTKPFGVKGLFYRVAGRRAAAVDGPCDYTIPPYNKYAKMSPLEPDKVARDLRDKLGHEVVIIDANDLGVDVLGKSSNILTDKFCEQVFKDNPLGQTDEQTPLCIVRLAK